MKKTLLLLGLLLMTLGAKSARAQAAPTATPASGAIIPTVTALSVSLQGPEDADILYSLNGAAEVVYSVPISLTATSTIEARTREVVEILDLIPVYQYSEVETFTYTKNTLPTVSITLPLDGAEFVAGASIELRAPANSGNTGDAITSVKYYNGADLLGSGNSGANRMFSWVGAPVGIHSITAVAVDSYGGSATSDAISITVTAPPNSAPIANAGANATTSVGADPIELDGTESSDPEGTDLTFAWAGPAGTGYTLTGAATATPSVSFTAAGSYIFTLTVTDEGGLTHSDPVTVQVGTTPTVTSAGTASGTVGTPFTYTITATGTAPITFSTSSLAGTGLTLSGAVLSGSPTTAGPKALTLTATNTFGTNSKTLNLTISAANAAPTANAGPNATTSVGADAIELDGSESSDPEGTDLTFAWAGPAGTGYTLTGAATATPSVSFTAAGSFIFTLTVTDEGGLTHSDPVTVQVGTTPTVTSAGTASGTVGAPFTYTITATGTAPITFSTSSLAGTGLTLSGAVLSGTPTTAGPKALTLTATNTFGTNSKTLNLTISAANEPPVTAITFPIDGETYYANFADPIRATASDDAGIDSVVFFRGATRMGKGTGSTGSAYSFTPPAPGLAAGSYVLTTKAYDNSGSVGTSAPVAITVAANGAPTARAGNDIALTLITTSVSAALDGSESSDPEDGPLAYLWTVPTGVAIAGSGATSPTPTLQFSSTGSHQIILRVTDAGSLTDFDTLFVTVRSMPQITSAVTASGNANTAFSYVMTATGTPAPTLTVGTLPAWLSWNAGTRTLSGTPTAAGAFSVVMTATNPAGSDSKTLAITIAGALTKPTITSPLTASVKVGTPFSYVMTATGTTPITFGATGLPAWMTFTAATGTLQGTPTATGNSGVSLTATNTHGNDSKVLSLAVTADPAITVDLDTLYTVRENGSVQLKVTATGFPAPTYQWQVGSNRTTFTNTGASTSNTLTLNPATLRAAGFYRVIVKNGAGPEKISRIARLAVTPLPVPIRIVAGSGPTAQTVTAGQRTTLKTKATGEAPLRYQWFKGSAAVTSPTVNDTTYILAAVTVNDAGVYRARVTNANTVETDASTFAWSDTARLTVNLPKLPRTIMSPDTGAFFPSMAVSLANDTPGTRIYYTLNRTSPSETVSPTNFLYVAGSPITLTATTAITTRSYKAGFQPSDERIETYTLTPPGKVLKPTIRPPTPTFQGTKLCTLATGTQGALIYYTTDGTSPLGPTARLFDKSILLDTTTTIIAIARKTSMEDSDTLMMTYTLETPTPNVFPPLAEPAGRTFSGKLAITLFSPTDSAAIWYTTDNSGPDTTKTRYTAGAPITINQTTTLKFMATRKGFLNSPVVTENYRLVPGNFTILPPPGSAFDSAITVTVSAVPANAEIRYELGGADPSATSEIFPSGGLRITTSANFSVIAYAGGEASEIVRFSYSKLGDQLATPIPKSLLGSTNFKDTVRVTLTSTPGADIYYTLNGGVPDMESAKYALPGILLDTTTTIQAMAMHPAFKNSNNMVATYTLAPGTPVASPPGLSTPDPIWVKLKSSSLRTRIYYTLDGSDPGSSSGIAYDLKDSIRIEKSLVLKSVAVAGHMSSPVAEENYEIFGEETIILEPGNNATLRGGYLLRNPEGQSVSVLIRLSNIDTLNLKGFESVQYGMTISIHGSGTAATGEFPALTFTRPASDKRLLYKVDPSGKVFFVTSKDTASLAQAGIYFTGVDVSPPVIRYVGESFDGKDSTEARFRIEDNVANLVYDLKRSDSVPLGVIQGSLISPKDLSIKLKNPAGAVKPLYLQLFVSDYQSPSFFPVDPKGKLALSQSMKPFKGPNTWKIGVDGEMKYDLISVPLNLTPALDLNGLILANGNKEIEGAVWNGSEYVSLEQNEVLKPGTGYWLASQNPLTALSLPKAATLPDPASKLAMRLRPGWNQIGNPHLEDLFWPVIRDEKYPTYKIKVLWEFDPKVNDFAESQVLKPWRGYYVYSFADADTTVELLREPKLPTLVAKKTTASRYGYALSLGWGSSRNLQLGADRFSRDGLGMEDEFTLPRPNNGPFMRAVREGRGLMSDWVHMEPDGILSWKVALDGDGDSLAPIRILGHEVPEGFETWAASQSRSMKFRVEAGTEISSSGLAEDTLLVYAGPSAKMAAFRGLKNLLEKAPDLDLRVSARNGGFLMHMALPSRAKVKATVWSLKGANNGELTVGPLSEGLYKFAYESDFRGRGQRLSPGMYVLSVEINGTGLPRRMTRKFILSN